MTGTHAVGFAAEYLRPLNVQTRQFTPEFEVRSDGEGRTLCGIVVPYGKPQRIDSRLVEQFAPGAFAAQLRAAHRVPLMRDHGPHGGKLIGRATMLREDAAGLYGEFRVSRTPLGDETVELAKDGALTDFSIGFREGQNRTLPGGITERASASLTEVAVVMAGAYGDAAVISAVRSSAAEQDVDGAALAAVEARASKLPYGPGHPLWRYWTGPEGFAKYARSPHPWRKLRDELIKAGVPVGQADGLTTNIMQATSAGRSLFKLHHGGK
ncbi:HK97 family phage prohead protease [Amycolatopsis echigonensis]|uniref:HK97 family phage prohead protease n=1 Tax=Amycolatopsis echigonensis TaxID=2576905 RepID=A0A8E1W2Z5_9PSEU|nr:HK97 family phage prohead protease [Amycolatopsis echigonensis]MBB2502941.1 HK97 family phage prohead protease [Amycolatopsis echigonensis]